MSANLDITISIPAHIVASIRSVVNSHGTVGTNGALTALANFTAHITPAVIEAISQMPAPAPRFSITIRTLAGRSYTVFVDESYAVDRVKHVIYDLHDIPPEAQRLVHEGKQLEDGRTMLDVSQSLLHVVNQ